MPFAKSPAGLGGSFRDALPCAIGGNGVTCAAGCLLTGEMAEWIVGLRDVDSVEGLCALLRDKSACGCHIRKSMDDEELFVALFGRCRACACFLCFYVTTRMARFFET